MKINTPVTNTEVNYPESYNLLSTTNLKGSLTYCNEDFIKLSGFDADELIGHNHNVVRHPDMPPAAFADLWSNIKDEKPWMGIVKNRCKDGSYYWVDAYVTPIKKDGNVDEYQSVRTKPDRVFPPLLHTSNLNLFGVKKCLEKHSTIITVMISRLPL